MHGSKEFSFSCNNFRRITFSGVSETYLYKNNKHNVMLTQGNDIHIKNSLIAPLQDIWI